MLRTAAQRVILLLNAVLFGTVLIPQVFHYLNRVEPLVLGLPLVVFWVVAVNVLGALSLTVLWFLDRKGGMA